MSVIEQALPVYVVRIPSVIYEKGKTLNIPLRCYGDLPELAKYFSLEDIYFFIRGQMHADLTAFIEGVGLKGLLSNPVNERWMVDHITQFDNYLRRMEDEQIIKGVSQTLPSSPVYTRHKAVIKDKDLTQRTIYIREVGNEDEQADINWLDENRKYERDFKFAIISELYDLVGFDALMKSNALNYLLAPGR